MDSLVQRLPTPEACERFIPNAIRRSRHDLAEQARQRAVELRAEAHGAETAAEKECLQAIYAYQEVLSNKNGRRTRASRTWQMVSNHGILKAAERAVDKDTETVGFSALAKMGLLEFAFEAVVLRYPHLFSQSAVERSRTRMDEWERAPR